MARSVGPRTYAPLTRYLAMLSVDAVLLPRAAVEQILGTALPASARQAAFWSNGQRGLFGRRPWTQAGWRVARTRLHAQPPMVAFQRAGSAALVAVR